MHNRARVDAIVTTTLRKVTVLTAHPNSFPLSSHRSEPSGQMLGFEMGVRRGQVTGLAMQVEDCSRQPLESMCRSNPDTYVRLDTNCNGNALRGKKCSLGVASNEGGEGQDRDLVLE
jgi:hypothetical protein